MEALELPKSTYHYRKRQSQQNEQEEATMMHIRSLIREHPVGRNSCDGYRRILPELRKCIGERINHNRLWRLLKEHELGLARRPKKRPPVRQILRDATGRPEPGREESGNV